MARAGALVPLGRGGRLRRGLHLRPPSPTRRPAASGSARRSPPSLPRRGSPSASGWGRSVASAVYPPAGRARAGGDEPSRTSPEGASCSGYGLGAPRASSPIAARTRPWARCPPGSPTSSRATGRCSTAPREWHRRGDVARRARDDGAARTAPGPRPELLLAAARARARWHWPRAAPTPWNAYGGPGSTQLDGGRVLAADRAAGRGLRGGVRSRRAATRPTVRRSLLLGFGRVRPTADVDAFVAAAEHAASLGADKLRGLRSRVARQAMGSDPRVHERALAQLR